MKSPPSQTEKLLSALRSLIRTVRAEKGFLSYSLYLEADDPNVICYEDRWTTQEDLDCQLGSLRFTRLLTLMEEASERPTLEFHFVSETRGLEYVETARGSK